MADSKEIKQKVDDLSGQVADFQAAIDAEQVQVAQAIADLQALVDSLRADVAANGTAEERQAIADEIDAVKTSLVSSKADLQSTIPDAPAPTPEG